MRSMLSDVFGIHPNAIRFCDLLVERGFHIVYPDFFDGKPYVLQTRVCRVAAPHSS
jgi:dienelactone hydrolase